MFLQWGNGFEAGSARDLYTSLLHFAPSTLLIFLSMLGRLMSSEGLNTKVSYLLKI